jgi:hypothetical protein
MDNDAKENPEEKEENHVRVFHLQKVSKKKCSEKRCDPVKD